MIVGVVLGFIVVFVLIFVLVYCCYWKKKKGVEDLNLDSLMFDDKRKG